MRIIIQFYFTYCCSPFYELRGRIVSYKAIIAYNIGNQVLLSQMNEIDRYAITYRNLIVRKKKQMRNTKTQKNKEY